VIRSINIRDSPLAFGALVYFDFGDKNDSSGESEKCSITPLWAYIMYHARGPMYKYTFDMVRNGATNTAAIFQRSTDIALFACSSIDINYYILGTVLCRFRT